MKKEVKIDLSEPFSSIIQKIISEWQEEYIYKLTDLLEEYYGFGEHSLLIELIRSIVKEGEYNR